jgi:hypothetical protein
VLDPQELPVQTIDRMRLGDFTKLMHSPQLPRLPVDILRIAVQTDGGAYIDGKPKVRAIEPGMEI